ncbi:hypothetical protein IEQ34_018191 [Dendrobium chrysotoxum]|uniref:Uncharacterized protein n=1 Tax=Dendrobium chrysotoxum TaxID=161865 RepID=A0AAV7GCL5_DENCH|nr:hypothetical protein IEQ34_018191 [Dendrobium chrysotoxum]
MQHGRVCGLGSQTHAYEGQTSGGSNFSSSTQESLYSQQIAALTFELEQGDDHHHQIKVLFLLQEEVKGVGVLYLLQEEAKGVKLFANGFLLLGSTISILSAAVSRLFLLFPFLVGFSLSLLVIVFEVLLLDRTLLLIFLAFQLFEHLTSYCML